MVCHFLKQIFLLVESYILIDINEDHHEPNITDNSFVRYTAIITLMKDSVVFVSDGVAQKKLNQPA